MEAPRLWLLPAGLKNQESAEKTETARKPFEGAHTRICGPQMLSTLTNTTNRFSSRPISMSTIVIVALMVHGPLLLMQLPAGSFDANFHIFFASHYAHHWFSPWN